MKTLEYDARIVALWLLHGGSWAKLLRAHGRRRHAENFEAALREVVEIVSDHVGREALTDAMDWASDQLWLGSDAEDCEARPKSGLN